MNKINIKTSDEFHNSVKSTLDNIMNEQNVYPANSLKKSMSIAASIVLLIVISLFTASAAGLINLDKAFTKLMGIENEPNIQKLASEMSTYELPAPVISGNGYTLHLIHSVNDAYSGIAMFELSGNENNLNNEVTIPNIVVKVDGKEIDAYAIPSVEDNCVLYRQTIEDYAAQVREQELEAMRSENKFMSAQQEMFYTLKYILENADSIKAAMFNTNKYNFNLHFSGNIDMRGKNISFELKDIDLHPNQIARDKGIMENHGICTFDEESIAVHGHPLDYYIVKTDLMIQWRLSDKADKKTVSLNKNISGIDFKEITVSPMSAVLTFDKSMYTIVTEHDDEGNTYEQKKFNSLDDETNFDRLTNTLAVKYKNGKTEVIEEAYTYTTPNYIVCSFNRIVDLNEIESILLGPYLDLENLDTQNYYKSFTEIPI